MISMKNVPLTLFSLLAMSLAGSASGLFAGEKPIVYVPVPPYQELVSRIAGDHYEVRTVVSESDDPHDYSPTPRQVVALSRASILFTGEMPFEEVLRDKLADGNKDLKIVSLTENLELLEGGCETCAHHSEGEDEVFVYVKGQDDAAEDHEHHHHDHDHEHGLDPHVWLSPAMLKLQAKTIAKALQDSAGSAEAADEIAANLEKTLAELAELDRELAEKLAFMKGETFYVYHGAFAYFARCYGLTQKAIEIGERRPEPKELADLIRQAKEDGVHLIFVQPQFDQTSARSLAEAIGGKVLPLDPLERDVFSNLRVIAQTLTRIKKDA